jgi:hypothetical protein
MNGADLRFSAAGALTGGIATRRPPVGAPAALAVSQVFHVGRALPATASDGGQCPPYAPHTTIWPVMAYAPHTTIWPVMA